MNRTDPKYGVYLSILNEELVPAMGCTEPIALAYAAALARQTLGALPEEILIQVSGSIIKNVKSVVVPNTGNGKGLKLAAAAGAAAGKAEKELEVIADVTPEQTEEILQYLAATPIRIEHVENGHVFDITVKVRAAGDIAVVRICDYHTHVVLIQKNDTVLQSIPVDDPENTAMPDRSLLDLDDIWDFALTCELDDVRELLDRQIQYNTAIAREGLTNDYGASIGKTLLDAYGSSDVRVRAKAMAAAGSDARMNGCEKPVIINSGSGNQGITCCVPVVEYARTLGSSHADLLRALVLSNLVAIHEKTGIGTLSAYCGAVSAAAGAGAGIVYLCGGSKQQMKDCLTNSLGTVSGIVCDGAKSSCASKIAESLDMVFLGYEMCKKGKVLQSGDGLIGSDAEKTIQNIGRLGRYGMAQTNNEILSIMIS